MTNYKSISYSSKAIWKKEYQSKFYKKGKNYNSKIRDKFFQETIDIIDKNFHDFFFMSCGTLLGYIRDNDFIDWDDNIDLSFFFKNNSLEKISKLRNILINNDYVSRLEVKENYIKLANYKYGYKLDLCSLKKDKNYLNANLYKVPIYSCENFKIIKFKNKKLYIPKEYKKYLSFLYNDWEKPKKNNYVTLKSLKIRNFKYFVYSGIKKFFNIKKFN